MSVLDIAVVAVGPNEIAVVQVGVQGPPGPQGPAGPAGGVAANGEAMSSGIIGTIIPVSGFAAPEDYQVSLTYAENPQGNGVLWYEKSATQFIVKHYGAASVKFSYIVSATEA